MKQRLLCKFFGLHLYEVFKEELITDIRDNVIGKIIISKCSICGKITSKTIYTEQLNYGN